MENTAKGTSILQVIAQDSDSEPRNRLIDYRNFNSSLPFDVSSSTGDVLVTGVLDYETKQQYAMVVLAVDHGTPRLSSSCIILITILDANDHPPVFSSPVYQITVNESTSSGLLLIQVRCCECVEFQI